MFKPLVTQEEFARISCMDGFAFGVNTACNSCDFMLNSCMRRSLRDALITNQQKTENILGFDLSRRYHAEEIDWDGRSKLQLSRRGVSALNVKESVTVVAGGPFEVSPFIIEDVDVISNIVTVSIDLIDNPEHAVLRNVDTNSALQQIFADGYPRRDGMGNWLIKINEDLVTCNIQHCKYMQVTIPTPVCLNGEIMAVQAGTEEFIPFAKDPVVDGSNTRYWFYAWSMVDPAFYDDAQVDLFSGQFYKLIPEIDFVCSKDIEALPVVLRDRSACSDNFTNLEEDDLVITLLYDGIIEIHTSSAGNCNKNNPLKIKVFYRTDPEFLNVGLENIAEGIVNLTAAELSIESCGCEPPKYGFIANAQKNYGELRINPITGMESWQIRYGSRQGQIVYAEKLSKIIVKQRLVQI